MMERMSANFSKGDDAIFNESLTYFNKNKDTNQGTVSLVLLNVEHRGEDE
jgi:hypothetical protein